MLGAVGDGGLGLCEEADHLRCKHIGKHTDYLCHDQRTGNTEAHALFHTVMLLGAQILTGEGAQRLAEAHHGQECETFQFGVSAAAVDGIRTKGEDVGLHHDICQRNHGVLHRRGQTITDDFLQTLLVEANFLQIQAGRTLGAHQVDATEHSADTLGNGGGKGGCAYAKAHQTNEEQIQHDVYHGGADEVV